MGKAKKDVSQWFGKLIAQVADWETSGVKLTLTGKTFRNNARFFLCINLHNDSQSSSFGECIIENPYNVVCEFYKLIIEDNIKDEKASMHECL